MCCDESSTTTKYIPHKYNDLAYFQRLPELPFRLWYEFPYSSIPDGDHSALLMHASSFA
jgi:hypothetical protein